MVYRAAKAECFNKINTQNGNEGDDLLHFNNQITLLEGRHKSDIPTAAMLALRYWQASRFAPHAPEANALIQRANHVALTTHRQNSACVDAYALAIFIAIEAGHLDNAAGMLEKIMGYKSFLRANAPRQYAALCFLYTYLEICQGRSRQANKHWRTLTDLETAAPSVDFTIMQGLLHLANNDFPQAFNHLREAFRMGSHSIFMYEGLYRYYRTTPHKPGSGIILAVLTYAANRGVDITDIALRHQHALLSAMANFPGEGEDLYNISGHLPLLAKICARRIAQGDVSQKAFAYYQQAEKNQVPVPGLHKYLVYAAFANNAGQISPHALARFVETEPAAGELGVYVYHLLLTTQGLEAQVQAKHEQILALAEECLAAGTAGRQANSLYYYFWQHQKDHASRAKAEEILGRHLTLFELLTPENATIRHVYITEPERRGMTVYDLAPGENTLRLEAASHRLSYTCLGAGRRVISDKKLTIRRMIPGVGVDLYQHFFDRGDRRFHLLAYLTNHYLQTPGNSGGPVLEAILEEKTIEKAYKMRVLAALGHLYYKGHIFDRALACYDQVDEDALDQGLTAQILSIYLQTNEGERAAQLIAKKYADLPQNALEAAIGTLLDKPMDHGPLAQAAYHLLVDGVYSRPLLDLVLTHYSGSYGEWAALGLTLHTHGIACPSLDKLIVQTALWMGAWDAEAQNAFVRIYQIGEQKEEAVILHFIAFATYQLLANAALPAYDVLDILEAHCLDREADNLMLVWGLASCYLRHNISTFKSEEVLALAVDAQERAGLLFPVFKESRFARVPFIEKHQPFLHKGLPGKNYHLNYRIDGEADFKTLPMTYVRYGIYMANIPLFYNEEVTYFFSETLENGSIATRQASVKNTTPFLHNHPTDQFFTINNAIIYEQMFKHDQVEKCLGKLVKDLQAVRSRLM